ncbi:lysM domain receptor-like kinase 3 [Mercurialis annua]|uniref:lysM domain receptor-like kinase 3 n=1 Tax=Mercurialis annua TaxID=3986 RepID=UPI00215EA86B|nr:lysM domain receptor-like kinase 3 [Mercurialis annua]
MCKTKMAVNVSDPNSSTPRPTQSPRTRSTRSPLPTSTYNSAASAPSTSSAATTSGYYTTTSSSTLSSRTSLSSLRESIAQSPNIYDISEIRAATNNFLAKRYSSSSTTTCWRCSLRNAETVVFQRKCRRKIEMSRLKERLSILCRSHHTSVIKLLGVCIAGEHIYLVYEFTNGANLADCLRNPRNPHFTVLSAWTSRMQIAADLAHGLDYIHHKTGLNLTLVHNHIKSSAIIVTEPEFHGKICHFGAAQLCGELVNDAVSEKGKSKITEITELNSEEEEGEVKDDSKLKRLTSGDTQFEGVRGYMSPEYQTTGIASQKADVYAFGVVILELLSGEEPLKFKFDKSSGHVVRTSVIETARAAVQGGDAEERQGRVRRWMDRRLKDSYPVDVAEKLTRLAIECVRVDADERPDMGRVAGKISKLYLSSRSWSDQLVSVSDQISVSLAPR